VTLDEEFTRTHAGSVAGEYVMLSVADNGRGMSKESLARVFEPFFTTKEKGKGSGLGLPMVYGIVKQSGGYTLVESEEGRGTTVKIFLPRVYEPVEDEPASKTEETPAGGETILFVEDEDEVREALAGVMKDKGYAVLEASNGAEALEIAEEHEGRIDLLVTDIVMPKMGGRELADKLGRAREGLRILFMSGYSDGEIFRGGLPEGAHFLPKPFTIQALGRKIREILD
jgi:CheY-like chemotaxis protein